MKNVLVTGGTVFVSRYISEYYIKKGDNVFVLNRNTKTQIKGVNLIEADRHNIGDKLRGYHFNVIFDVNAYTSIDINLLLDAVESYDDYIFISSSAVYPEYCPQPIRENTQLGLNKFWGNYGTHKIAAEQALLKRNSNAYIIRPPYLYGQMNNVYRESFVFDCALKNRKFFYLNKEK
ncbi:MAG: NAD-dependent epimerase/dehydratase family protein [Coprobacillus sp.]